VIRRALALAAALAACLVVPDAPPAARAEGPVIVAGSGSNLAATHALADAFRTRYPGTDIQVPPSIGSTGGVRAVADGTVAIGLISRPLTEGERSLGLTVVPYARTAIVLGAHPTVADAGVSTGDLVAIYAGRKTTWSDGRDIVVLTRQPGDSSIEVLQAVIPGFKQAYLESQQVRRWATLFTDRDMDLAVMRTPYAIGLVDMGAIRAGNLAIKALRMNGVAPTAAEVTAGRYTLVKALAFVVDPRRKAPEAQRFIDFSLSKEGATVLATIGYLPPPAR
jgi:phosphate transport system substrate-binding protein